MKGYIELATTPGGLRVYCSDPADRPRIRRHLRALCKRLANPVVVALCDERCPLSDEYRKIGIERHLLDLSEHELAVKYDLPIADIRRVLAFVRGYAKARRS